MLDSRRQRPGEDTKEAAMARRSRAIAHTLSAMIRECYRQRFGGEMKARDFPLDLSMVLSSDGKGVRFDPPLLEQLIPQLDQMEAAHAVYQPGRVYCFHCEQSNCAHGSPGSPLEVFRGYDQLGRPVWRELAQFLLDLKDERVDRLFEERPKVLARVIPAEVLRAKQLAPFGKSSKTYAPLGQVIAGYFRPGLDQADRLALTFQVVEVRDGAGLPSLALNTLCGLPQPWSLEESRAGVLGRALAARRRASVSLKKLKGISGSGAKRGHASASRVADILHELASQLEKATRVAERQTKHAGERRRIRRPIDKAMADLRIARRERVYLDQKTKTIVLWADKGRCHVFNQGGRHVTSFVIQTDAVETRLRKKRWVPIEPERYQRFMERLSSPREEPKSGLP